MVCIYCGGKTHITNTRPQRRLRQTWRRHTCVECHAIFTTNEAVDLSTSIVVRDKNRLTPFSRDRLFISIYKAIGHRETAIADASALSATIIAKLIHDSGTAAVSPFDIIATVSAVLQHFDRAGAVHYTAYHKTTSA
jgi:transcriptional regulator NrdR family protein